MKDANDYIVGPGQFYLFKITDTLDNINYIRDREKAYYQAYSELEKFIPYMDEVNKYKFERNKEIFEFDTITKEFPDTWEKFVELFHKVKPVRVNVKGLEREFYKELDRRKQSIIKDTKIKKCMIIRKNLMI